MEKMAFSRQHLQSELIKLEKTDLIDLLLLPVNEQKCDKLRKIKNQLFFPEKNDNALSTDENKQVNSAIDDNQPANDSHVVGVYMAYSIFHGYLKLVIPNTGGLDPHLEELMQDYEANEKIKFDFYKIFLLIPKSTYCPTSLDEVSKRIQKCRPLAEKIITRAGVQNRSYKNSVYKISNKEKNTLTYVVAEYATPVQTYKDVMDYNYGKDSEAYKRNRNNVLEEFNQALIDILKQHRACTDYCELIFYNDEIENGKRRDLADVIMERIETLKNE